MIDRQVIMDCAERAGFGGATRPKLFPRLEHFAQLILEHQQHRYVDACVALGDAFEILKTEFSDGQMDGAYRCAEIIQVGTPAFQSHRADACYSTITQTQARGGGSAHERIGTPKNAESETTSQGKNEETQKQKIVYYFGQAPDILESLGGELNACANMHRGDVKDILNDLSNTLINLSPLLIALDKYCSSDTLDDYEVVDVYEQTLKTRKIVK